ncbi:MAG: hypothetical protein ISS25_02270 [Nanoarchaeota archaeon]|nr:hypothetical protein [DPANN group archaeon]MBL7116631.1 hypothetical protein [Nanoarchaeota archaeon]
MKINELQSRQQVDEISVEVVEIGPVREFQKFGEAGRVASATVKDSSGQTTMTLWNDQVDLVKPGDKIKLENGYVNEWQGEIQLTTGRKGTIKKL